MATRLTLRTAARIAADQDNSTFPDDTTYNVILDQSARTVWRRMLGAGWKPDRTSITTNLVAGTSQYTIGTDVSVIHSVMFIQGNVRTPLTRIKPEDLPSILTLPAGQPQCYDILNGGTVAFLVELYPTPSAGGQVDIRYTKRFPGFTADGDTWIGPDGSDELIILLTAIEGARKEDNRAHIEMLETQYTERYKEVTEAMGWLDSQGQQRVRDAHTYKFLPGDYNVQDGDR